MQKKAKQLISASLVTGAAIAGTAFGLTDGNAAEASQVKVTAQANENQGAINTANSLYNSAFKGQFPKVVEGLKIGVSTKADVYKKIGTPEMPASGSSSFDVYSANMGNPGYAFSYNTNGTIKEIRYFGTNVERQTNLGRVTPVLLEKQFGVADEIRKVPGTGEKDYVYKTGKYEVRFIIKQDGTASHVNLVER